MSAGGSHAELAAFEGIDTKQPDTFAVDFDGVAIDYGRRPDNATRCLQNSDDTRWSADKPVSVFRVSDTGARAKASLNKHLAYRILFLIWILSPRCAIFKF